MSETGSERPLIAMHRSSHWVGRAGIGPKWPLSRVGASELDNAARFRSQRYSAA